MNLTKLRGNRSLTKVAKDLNISKSYLSLIENGKRRLSLEIAKGLSNIYGVTIDEIYNAYKVYNVSTRGRTNNKFSPTGTDGV